MRPRGTLRATRRGRQEIKTPYGAGPAGEFLSMVIRRASHPVVFVCFGIPDFARQFQADNFRFSVKPKNQRLSGFVCCIL